MVVTSLHVASYIRALDPYNDIGQKFITNPIWLGRNFDESVLPVGVPFPPGNPQTVFDNSGYEAAGLIFSSTSLGSYGLKPMRICGIGSSCAGITYTPELSPRRDMFLVYESGSVLTVHTIGNDMHHITVYGYWLNAE